MKKNILLFSIIASLFCSSCKNENDFPKPDKLIEKEDMEKILYDLALLQALKSYSSLQLEQNGVNPKTYIYQKYKIDSIQFTQNSNYYVSNIEEYKLMFENVAQRLKKQKTENDTLLNRENRLKSKKISDSLTKAVKKAKAKIAEQALKMKTKK
jgi:Domain of unknown function (DUF4296)